MGDALKWVDFSLINVWYGNLPSGQTPTEVPRLELTEEMEGSLNFLSSSSVFFFLIYWQSRVLNFGTNILISCPCLSSLSLAWNNSDAHRFRLHPALQLQSSYLADASVISSLSESCPQVQKGSCSFTVAPLESSRQQETEKSALLVQLAFTAEDNTDRKSVGVGIFLEGEENWGSKIKRSLSLIFYNRVLFPRFYSCNILCVWPDPSQHSSIEGGWRKREEGWREG